MVRIAVAFPVVAEGFAVVSQTVVRYRAFALIACAARLATMPICSASAWRRSDIAVGSSFMAVFNFHRAKREALLPLRGFLEAQPTASFPIRAGRAGDASLSAGFRLWQGAELWIDPEIDQGFGVSNTEGVVGYVNGAAAKVGAAVP